MWLQVAIPNPRLLFKQKMYVNTYRRIKAATLHHFPRDKVGSSVSFSLDLYFLRSCDFLQKRNQKDAAYCSVCCAMAREASFGMRSLSRARAVDHPSTRANARFVLESPASIYSINIFDLISCFGDLVRVQDVARICDVGGGDCLRGTQAPRRLPLRFHSKYASNRKVNF